MGGSVGFFGVFRLKKKFLLGSSWATREFPVCFEVSGGFTEHF